MAPRTRQSRPERTSGDSRLGNRRAGGKPAVKWLIAIGMVALAFGLLSTRFREREPAVAMHPSIESRESGESGDPILPASETADTKDAPLDPEAQEVVLDPPTLGDIIDLHKCIVDVELWSRGNRYTESVAVEIWGSEDDGARKDSPNSESRLLGRQHTTHGVANFINIEPGLLLTGRAEIDHVVYRSDDAHPTATREQSRVVVRIEIPSIPRFRVRLLAENGRALPHRDLRVRRFRRTGDGGVERLLEDRAATDALGTVEVGFPVREVLAGSYGIRFESGMGKERIRASVDVTASMTLGTHDLADLVMRPPQAIATGRVVDAQGEPIDQATVTLSRALFESADRSGNGKARVAPPLIETTVITDDAGHFEIYGFQDDGEFELTASHPTHSTSAGVKCQETAFDVVIELPRGTNR